MLTGWNWLGILLWIIAIGYFIWVIHYIRVQQLLLIIKTQKSFEMNHFLKYCGLFVVAVAFLGTMTWLSFFRQVDMTDQRDVDITTQYNSISLNQIKGSFYYATAEKSKSGKQPVVAYSYWISGKKNSISSRTGTISAGKSVINMEASVYPWNVKRINSEDLQSGHAFVATMTIKYEKSFLNGLGVRSGHVAGYYTLIRVPSSDFVYKEFQH